MFRWFTVFFVSFLYVSIAFGGGVIPPRQYPNEIEWVPGEVLVKFKDDVEIRTTKGVGFVRTNIGSITELNRRYKVKEMEKVFKTAKKRKEKKYIRTYTGEVIEVPQLFNWYKLKVPDDADIIAIMDAYKSDPNVEYAEPNYIARTCVTPNDSLYAQQWGLPAIHAPEAWDIEQGDSTLIIGILDTGVEWDHPDLADKVVSTGYDFVNNDNDAMDDNGHGTHVAGIAAAATDNSIGIAGVAWNCKILPVKVMQSNGYGTVTDISNGAVYAANSGAKIINMSFGCYTESYVLRDALENAYTTCVLVAAAGNDGTSIPFYPAAWSFVIGVGASDVEGRAGFSNYGINADLYAPGVNIYSTLPEFHPHGYTYASWSGTSMAAPFVTGVVALLRSHFPSWSNELIMGQLIHTSDQMVNAYRALTKVPEPQLALYSHTIIDTLPGDDRDGIADAGETVEMVFDIQNTWGQAYNVEATISPHSYEDTMFITILDSTATFGSCSPYAHVTNNTNPFKFYVKPSTPNNMDIYFDYEITCDGGYSFPGTFHITAQRGIEISGVISSDMTLTPDYLYIVTGNVLVDSGVTLTIKPGTRIQFDPGWYLMVDGCLKAIGTEDSMIVFTSNAQNPAPGDWDGIRFRDKSVDAQFDADGNYVSGSIIKYSEIEFSGGILLDTASPYIAQNFIHDNRATHVIEVLGCEVGGAMLLRASQSRIEYNLIRCNFSIWYGGAIGLEHADAHFKGNIIEDNYTQFAHGGAFCIVSSSPTIVRNIIRGNYSPLAGGAFFLSWGLSSSPVIERNLIYANSGDDPIGTGGGWFSTFGQPFQFQYNTLMGNVGAIHRLNDAPATINYNNFLDEYPYEIVLGTQFGSPSSDIDAQHNYWGTTNTDSIDERIWDYYDDFNLGEVIYQPIESLPVQTAPGFLWQVEFNPPPPIGCEVDTITLIFSKPMDISVQPMVSFGVCDPWTQHIVEGDWIDSTHWQGTHTFNIMTGDGINHLRVAYAKDCEGVEIPKDTRFSFVVDAVGASSVGFIAQAGDNEVYLQWPKPELVDLMGYNLYRYQKLTDTTFSDTILVNNQLILDTFYTDETVHNDTTYFYMFTVVSTDFKESDYSNPVSATPMAAPEPPVLSSPANNSAINDTTPTFVWHSSVSPNVSYYTLEYADNSDFVDPTIVTTADTFYTVDSSLSETTWYWRVRATNTGNITGDWSSTWSFEIDITSPEVPQLVSPVNGAYSDSSVVFEWTEVTKLSPSINPQFTAHNLRIKDRRQISEVRIQGIDKPLVIRHPSLEGRKPATMAHKSSPIRYVLQVDTTIGFTTPVIMDTVTGTNCEETLFKGYFYWRVKAYDLAGNEGPYSSADSFIVVYKGDVNEDTLINVLDLVRTVNIVLGKPPTPTEYELFTADVAPVLNGSPAGDSVVNILDVVALAYYITHNQWPAAKPKILAIKPEAIGHSQQTINYRSTRSEKRRASYSSIYNSQLSSQALLSVGDGSGAPGSINNPVDIGLQNEVSVGGIQFTLSFDSLLSVDSVTLTTHISHMTLGYNTWDDSVKVLVYSASGDSILPDSLPILCIFFNVDSEAVEGDSSLLHVEDCVLSDPIAQPISCETHDGCFYYKQIGIEDTMISIPKVFTVRKNYPNPFVNQTVIKYGVPRRGKISIVIYNLVGQRVITLFEGVQDAGWWSIKWDGKDEGGRKVTPGIYFYRIKWENTVAIEKIVVL